MTAETLARVVVIGSSCAGKTTLARALGHELDAPVVELDALFWGRNWCPRPHAEFARDVDAATAAPRWIVDGNYHNVRHLIWPRATAVVWLNLGFATVLARALRRTVARSIRGETLFAGNRESLWRAFLSRESILLWVIRTHRRRRTEFAALRASDAYPGLRWIELREPVDPATLLASVVSARACA